MHQYNLSKDYSALYEAVKDGAVAVGFVPPPGGRLQDVCKIVKSQTNGFLIGWRGKQYHDTFGESLADFTAMCEEAQLEYIPFTNP